MNTYELSRNWFNFSFENPERITPNHTALYFFCVEHCNRLGGKEKFGLPTTLAKEAIGIRSYNTYIKTLNDLVEFGFIILIEKSRNQYSSNIIALSKFDKAFDKALDKALIKHVTKQSESTQQSIDSIIKQETINNKQINIENEFEKFRKLYPGSKRGFETEYDNFKKKISNHEEIVFLLLPALEKLNIWRLEKKQAGGFVPEMANLSTWINQRRWEVELEKIEKGVENGGKENKRSVPENNGRVGTKERIVNKLAEAQQEWELKHSG